MTDFWSLLGEAIIILGLIQLVEESDEHEKCKKKENKWWEDDPMCK